MPKTKAKVDELIQQLRDLSPEVRLDAISQLTAIDRVHALPALHWAIQNELDDDVRNTARDAYQKLYKQQAASGGGQGNGPASDKTRNAQRSKVKAVVLEEGAPNPAGTLSFYIGLGVITAFFILMLLTSGLHPNKWPPVYIYWPVVAGALSAVGLGLGIIGWIRKEERHLGAVTGTVLNGLVVLIYFFKVVLPMLLN